MNVVISGASRGIGLALVQEYLAWHHKVLAVCRDPASAHDLSKLRESHPDLVIQRGDVSDAASVADVKASIGNTPVHVLLNVAGYFHLERCPEDVDFNAWATSFDVMAIGPMRMLTALLPNLEIAKGKAVSITSQVGASDWEAGGFYAYGAAKAALNRSMKSLAVDLRERGVSVGLIHPGVVKTDMTGLQGDISPEESARGIKHVSDGIDVKTTGQFFNWDGTRHAW